MVESGIPSARQKLARGQKHMRSLDRAVKEVPGETPYDFAPDSIPNERSKTDFYLLAVVTRAAPIRKSWALITGDIQCASTCIQARRALFGILAYL
jgi:hypothetical protein